MIRVIYSELDGPEGLTLRLEASGHAGYAPAGQDIVCAGASTLMQALVSLLAGEKTARSDAWDEPEGPRLAVTAAAPQEPWVEGAFELAKAGFALLAERYPDNVRFADRSARGKQEMMDLQLFADGGEAAAPALSAAQEGVMHISLAFLNEGDGVLIPNPGYPTYASVSKLTGARILPYALKEENDWQPDFEALEKMDLSGVKLMWCNYPNMPTGANGSRELFEKLVAFGRRHNIVICHDNPYSFILNDRPLSILSVPGAKEICIELNSMSKTFNMPGWRIGMVATNSRFLEWILRVKSNMDSGMFRPMQLAAVEALKAPDSWYQRMNEVYRRRRALAARILETLGCDVRDDQVGMFLWGRVNDTLAAQLTAAGECPNGVGEAICNRVLHQSRVFITPGFIFGSEGRNYIRISLCCNEEMLQEALDRITTTRTKQNQ